MAPYHLPIWYFTKTKLESNQNLKVSFFRVYSFQDYRVLVLVEEQCI